ncbi:hypothetical protein B7494_g3478 [Chlorociboria aeruginascens]|nr:hypothetical protein B7494_g3478 [Chlorociboria aeruginascens]
MDMDMDMSTTNATAAMTMSQMAMAFFTATDTPLYSMMWMPTSTGQYAGTCIFLIILAVIYRGLLAIKAWKETAWLDAEFNRRYVAVAGKLPKSERIGQDSDSKRLILTENGVEENVIVVKKRSMGIRPWRLTTDPIRAVMDTLIAGVAYLLAQPQISNPDPSVEEQLLGNFPCGGQATVSANRTLWPLSGGAIALTMGHIDANVEVLIGFGDSVGTAFNTVLRPTFEEQGLGAFCMTGFAVEGVDVAEDITFSSAAPGPAEGVCINGTSVTATGATISGSPNGTTATSTSAAAASSSTENAAVLMDAELSGLIVAGLAGLAIVL